MMLMKRRRIKGEGRGEFKPEEQQCREYNATSTDLLG